MCLWAIYIFPVSVNIFPAIRIGRSILGICKSLTDTWIVDIGTEAAQFPEKEYWDFRCSVIHRGEWDWIEGGDLRAGCCLRTSRNEHRKTKNVKKQSLQYCRSSWVRMDVFLSFYCTCFFILWWQDPRTSVHYMCEVATWIVAGFPPQWMTINLLGILVKNSLLSSQGELVFSVTDVCIDSAGLCVCKKYNIIIKIFFPTVM